MSYTYPFDSSWSKDEIVQVVQFFTLVERAYETGIERDILLAGYRKFKQVVPSKSEEKRFFAEFEKESGYSGYQVIKMAKEAFNQKIKL
jgi:uncharacterized protein YktA (UPF0223 family)